MQDIINLLPDSVANQIAAGEVVQRPSSVVKELMENAIDAGATKVQVVIGDGGRALIQVIDNGCGMSETDARMAFERHATSKITSADDLFRLGTMGFRGEALASIVAVAQVELITRRECDELGTRIVMAGSQIESQEPEACASGSNFKVKNLFFNIPARRKFLKSTQTEFNNIVTEFERVALVNCNVEFTLRHNDNETINLPVSSFRQRILNLFGKRVSSSLVEVEVKSSLINISGFVGTPESARKKGVLQYFFVNGRFMKHPYFAKAVMEAYSKLIPPGEQVPYFLNFSVDPSRIDVNIHPTKTEIKFEDEQSLWKIIAASVREALGRFNAVPGLDFDVEELPDIPVLDRDSSKQASVSAPKISYNPDYNPFKRNAPDYRGGNVEWERMYEGVDEKTVDLDPFAEEDLPPLAEERQSEFSPLGQAAVPDSTNVLEAKEEYIPISQYKGQYILIPVKSGLMWVHQRRAHIRVLYDKYLQQLSERKACVQGLLFPERVDLTVNESVALDAIIDDLYALGFDISSLGGGSYALQGVPVGIEGLAPDKLLVDIVHSVMDETKSAKEKLDEKIALAMAKKVAIVMGQMLSAEEMNSLVEDLFNTASPARTPDGKIIIYMLSDSDINKNFA